MTPDDIDVWVGLDVGKSAHHAHALDRDGDTLYDKPVRQDEKAIRSMLEHLSRRGRVLLVVDQPNTIGSLPLTVARDMGIAVAYLPGTRPCAGPRSCCPGTRRPTAGTRM